MWVCGIKKKLFPRVRLTNIRNTPSGQRDAKMVKKGWPGFRHKREREIEGEKGEWRAACPGGKWHARTHAASAREKKTLENINFPCLKVNSGVLLRRRILVWRVYCIAHWLCRQLTPCAHACLPDIRDREEPHFHTHTRNLQLIKFFPVLIKKRLKLKRHSRHPSFLLSHAAAAVLDQRKKKWSEPANSDCPNAICVIFNQFDKRTDWRLANLQ